MEGSSEASVLFYPMVPHFEMLKENTTAFDLMELRVLSALYLNYTLRCYTCSFVLINHSIQDINSTTDARSNFRT